MPPQGQKVSDLYYALRAATDELDRDLLAAGQKFSAAGRQWAREADAAARAVTSGAAASAAKQAQAAAASMAQVSSASKKAAFDLASLVPAFNGLAARVTHVDSTIGTLAGTLGTFALGGGVTGIALAGITALGFAYDVLGGKARDAAKKAKEAAEETRRALDRAQNTGDVDALAARAKTLFEGTAASQFKDGIRALDAAIAEKEKDLAAFGPTQGTLFVNRIKRELKALRDQVRPLREEFVDITRRIQEPGPSPARSRDPVVATATAPGALAKGAEKATSELASFLRETAQLTAKAAGDMLADLDRQLADLEAKAKKLRAEHAPEVLAARAALEEQRRHAETAQRIAEEERDRAARASQTRELDSSFTDARLGRITEQFTQARDAVEALHLGLRGLADDPQLGEKLLAWSEQLQAIVANEALANEQRQRAQALLGEVDAAYDRAFGGRGAPKVKETADQAKHVADDLARGARALLDAASAAGLLDANLSSALQSAVNLADNIARIVKSKGADLGADLGAVASVLALGKAVFGQGEAERQRVRTDDANRRALEALTKAVGDLVGLSVGGETFSRVRSAVGGALAGLGPLDAKGAPVSDATRFRGAERAFQAAGVTMEEVESVARVLNITLDGTVGSFRALDAAVRKADFAAFSKSWAGLLAELDVLFDVDNVDSPLARLQAFADRFGGSESAALQAITNGRDLATDAGRAEARLGARQILDQYRAGTLDPHALGKLSPGEFLDAIRRFIDGIDAVEQGIRDAATRAEEDARALGELTRRQLDEAERAAAQAIVDNLRAAAEALDRAREELVRDTLSNASAGSSLRDADAVGELVDFVTALGKLSPTFAGLLRGLDLTTLEGIEGLRRRLRDLFESIKDGTFAIDLGALTFDQLTDALLRADGMGRRAAESIRSTAAALADAAHSAVQSRLLLLRNRNGALGIDPNLSFEQALAIAGKDPLLAPYLDGVTTPAGLQKAYQDFLKSVSDPARLDQYTPEQLQTVQNQSAAFEQLLGFVPPNSVTIPGSVAPGMGGEFREIATSAGAITEKTAVDVATLLRSSLTVEQAQLDELRMIREAMTTPVGGGIQPPPFAAIGAYRRGQAAGEGSDGAANPAQVTITVIVQNVWAGGAPADAAGAYAQGFGDGVGANLNSQLGSYLRFDRRTGGDRTPGGRTS